VSGITLSQLLELPTPADMVDGYLDGFEDERDEYPAQSNRSEAYRHGWLDGRDDRLGTPRASAQVIRDEAARIIKATLS
jgi:hypothetical protein